MISHYDLIDLTHTLNADIPTWTGECGFHKKTIQDYPSPKIMNYSMMAGAGTHIDAPSHFCPGGHAIHEIPLEELYCPIYLISVQTNLITLKDVENHEKQYGKMEPGGILLGSTGWDKHWNNPDKYRSADEQGNTRCPGFTSDIGPFILERKLVGLGIDTLSPDGSDMTFPLHVLLLGNGKYLIENLTNLEKVPPRGAYLVALPLKIEGGAESPIRAIALVPKSGHNLPEFAQE
jgi:kynurenine formamidase